MAALEQGSVLGDYEIQRLLGAGGMGEVYLAVDRRLDRKVAVKILPDQFSNDTIRLKRFQREAKAASTISHPNICTIHEIGRFNGKDFIVMEYIEGKNLLDVLAERSLTVEEAREVAIQIADALEAAHNKNILHRDIKSGNIMLTGRKQVKILDFGLAKPFQPEGVNAESDIPTASRLTNTGAIVGTLTYLSPEQALGKQIDHRSDLFSFGVVLYQMLTGKLPFAGQTTTEVLDAILNKQPQPVTRYNEDVPDSMARVVRKLLQKDPEERYQSAHEVWTDLRQLKEDLTPPARLPSKRLWRNRLAFPLVLVVTLIVGYLFTSQRADKKPAADLNQISSLVALPCKVYGAENVGYLTEAVPNTLSNLLAQIEGLETKMPPTLSEYEGVGGDLKRLAELYDVQAFVVSNITAAPDQFVLNVQLVDAGKRSVFWSRQYEGNQDDYIDLTRKAADGMRQALRPSTTPIDSTNGLAATSQAELAYRQGQFYANRHNNLHEPRDFEIAYESYQRALKLDPKFADAAAAISFLYVQMLEATGDPNAAVTGKEWGRKAIKIDRKCSLGWTSLAYFSENFYEGTEYGLKAVSLDENSSGAHQVLAGMLSYYSLELSLSGHSRAQQLDPFYLYPYGAMANRYYMLGRSGEGLPWVDQALAIEPQFTLGLFFRSVLLADLNRPQEAEAVIQQVEKHVAEKRFQEGWSMMGRTAVDIANGRNEAESSAFRKLKELMRDPHSAGHDRQWIAITLLPALLKAGRTEAAIELLLQCSDPIDAPQYDWLMLNPNVARLCQDPGLNKIVEVSRGQFNKMLRILEEAKQRGELPEYLDRAKKELLSKLNL